MSKSFFKKRETYITWGVWNQEDSLSECKTACSRDVVSLRAILASPVKIFLLRD